MATTSERASERIDGDRARLSSLDALNPSPSTVELEVRRIRALLDRSQFAAALTAAETLLVEVPENRDVLYMIAVSQRYLGRIPDALATLERFEKIHPDYSRLFQERGHCRVAERAADAAIQAYLRAVNLNPALPASWKALQVLFRMTGQAANADMASAQVTALANLPVEIVTASSMFADGEIYDAERIVRQYLLAHGNHIEGMRLLARSARNSMFWMMPNFCSRAFWCSHPIIKVRDLTMRWRSGASQVCPGNRGTRQVAQNRA